MRTQREPSVTLEDILQHAHKLVSELGQLLPETDGELFCAKLARAHALGLIDQLEETIESRPSLPSDARLPS